MNKFIFDESDDVLRKLKHYQIDKNDHTWSERSLDELESIGHLLKGAKKILDLGCGLGRSSIYLKNNLGLDECEFFLADFDEIEFTKTGPCGTHDNADKIAYNKFEKTEKFCKLNNFGNFELIDLATDQIKELSDIDIVYSFHSIGYHWDIESAFEKYCLNEITSDSATFIFGIRKGTIPERLNSFENQEVIEGLCIQDFVIYRNGS